MFRQKRFNLKYLFSLCVLISFSQLSYANKAVEFNLQGQNKIIQLSSYKGKIIYLDFWASWCVPCRQSFPFMNKMQKKYADKGLEIIAINLDEDIEKARQFLKMIPAAFTIAYDPEGKASRAYKVSVVPTFYLLNRQGNIVYKHTGFRHSENEKIEIKIQQLLVEKPKQSNH